MKSLKASVRLKTISAISNGTSGRSIVASTALMSAALLSSLTTTKGGPLTFTRASSVTAVDYAGVLQTLGNNVPAFDGMRLSYDLAEGATLGPELIIGGSLDSVTGWIVGAGWTISGGKATADNATSLLYRSSVVTTGKRYAFSFTVAAFSGGSVTPFVSYGTSYGTARSATGSFTEVITANDAPVSAGLSAAGFTGSIDNISVREVIPVWVSTALDGVTPLTGRGILSEPAVTNIFANPLAPATQTITVTAAQYVLSFYGTGSIAYSGVATGTLVGTGANNRVQVAFTPTAGSLTLTLTGTITNPQLEVSPTGKATSPAISSAATTTRAATILSEPIADLPTAGTRHLQFIWTPQGYKAGVQQYLWSSYVDASNHTNIQYDGSTSLILRKRIAGTAYDATLTITPPTLGTSYLIDGYINADNSTAIKMLGATATNSDTHAPVLGTTMQWASQNGVSQAQGWLKEAKILRR